MEENNNYDFQIHTGIAKRGRKPLTDEERELRKVSKKEKQKEFYNKNKKYFSMKYNSYLLDKSVELDIVKKKLENSRINYELLEEIYKMKLQQN